jgi:glutathione S-transferase
MTHFDVAFRERTVELSSLDISMWERRERLMPHSPSGLVPVLRHGGVAIWESIAICEYLNERFPGRGMWPADATKRAIARSVSAEMHAGFGDLRNECPVDVGHTKPTPDLSVDARKDVARIQALWGECRVRHGSGGEFLFGGFSIADAMFAPVVTRFRTYRIAVDGPAAAYADAVWNLPAMQAWVAGARTES